MYTFIGSNLAFSKFPDSKNVIDSDTIHRESNIKEDHAHHELQQGYYLVIGVFDHHINAIRYTNDAKKKGLSANFGYVHDVMRYYVYTFYSPDYNEAKNHKNTLRESHAHKDAWILKYLTDKNALHTIVTHHHRSGNSTQTHGNQHVPPPSEALYKTYKLFAKVTSEHSGKPINAKVKLINTEKAQLLATFTANTPITLHLPKDENQNVEFVCDEFGYRKMNLFVNLEGLKTEDSLGNAISQSTDTIFVNIKLKPYKKGDVVVLYNVYFYDNSSLIRPLSISQLNSVYEMLAENSHIHVKIHGHTNGDQFGQNIYLAEGDTNFYKVTPQNIRKPGSAVALSSARATTIKQWLEHKGIDPKRIDTKAWGGKKKLYDNPHDFNKNIRVELEILKDSK
jgi:outer membrane protein OmpA-like peptidoglycan-associated protein